MKWIYGILLLSVLCFWGCQLAPAPAPGAVMPTPEQQKAVVSPAISIIQLPWDQPTWSQHLLQKIGENLPVFLAAKDVTEFCPTIRALPKVKQTQVLGEMFVRIAYWESGFNPKSTYQEPPPPKGPGTLSVGLFQMSYGDGDGCPASRTTGDLTNPMVNIDCAVGKAVALVRKYGVIITSSNLGMGKYWSTIRASGHGADIRAHTQGLCK